jgi:hypothetical protein
MGWCSGTCVFYPVIKAVLEQDAPKEQKIDVIKSLIIALQDADWDCETDTDYWKHQLVRRAFKKTCPSWDWKDIEENE